MISKPVDKQKPFRSTLWPPPGDQAAAHRIIPGMRQCSPDCPCWAARRGKPEKTKMLLIHDPSEDDPNKALCGGSRGWVTGVEFYSVVTCPECRTAKGERANFIDNVELVDTIACEPHLRARTNVSDAARAIGSKGGKATAAKMDATQRRTRAQAAATARWAKRDEKK